MSERMARIASFHLVRSPSRRRSRWPASAPTACACARVAGLEFWRAARHRPGQRHRAVGRPPPHGAVRRVARRGATSTRSSPTRRSPERWSGADEQWHVRLRGLGGHGSWRGVDVLDGLERGDDGGPIAVVTRADVHVRAWRDFRAAGRPVSVEVQRAPGLLAVAGIGELPVGRLGTFSLWSGLDAIAAFAASARGTATSSAAPATSTGTARSCSPASSPTPAPAPGTAATRWRPYAGPIGRSCGRTLARTSRGRSARASRTGRRRSGGAARGRRPAGRARRRRRSPNQRSRPWMYTSCTSAYAAP